MAKERCKFCGATSDVREPVPAHRRWVTQPTDHELEHAELRIAPPGAPIFDQLAPQGAAAALAPAADDAGKE